MSSKENFINDKLRKLVEGKENEDKYMKENFGYTLGKGEESSEKENVQSTVEKPQKTKRAKKKTKKEEGNNLDKKRQIIYMDEETYFLLHQLKLKFLMDDKGISLSEVACLAIQNFAKKHKV